MMGARSLRCPEPLESRQTIHHTEGLRFQAVCKQVPGTLLVCKQVPGTLLGYSALVTGAGPALVGLSTGWVVLETETFGIGFPQPTTSRTANATTVELDESKRGVFDRFSFDETRSHILQQTQTDIQPLHPKFTISSACMYR